MKRFPVAEMAALLVFNVPAAIAAEIPKTGFWSLQVENDTFGSNDDRYYTNGIELSFATAESPPRFPARTCIELVLLCRYRRATHGP